MTFNPSILRVKNKIVEVSLCYSEHSCALLSSYTFLPKVRSRAAFTVTLTTAPDFAYDNGTAGAAAPEPSIS